MGAVYMSRFRWCEQVCYHVRFRPDHKDIKRELMAHMEDGMAEFAAAGLSKDEAERAVLERMGDPAEVGKQLDAVHKPWLGRLWLLSKWLLILCAVGFVFLLFTAPGRLGMDLEDLSGVSFMDGVRLRGCTDYSDGYLFVLDQAAFWENGSSSDGAGTVKLRLRVWDLLGNGYPDGIANFTVADSEGNEYDWGDGTGMELFTRVFGHIFAISVEGVPAEAEWVELRYTDWGRDIRLRTDLPGGDVS